MNKKKLNDIENKVSDLHKKFSEKFGTNKIMNLVGNNIIFNQCYERAEIKSITIDGKSKQKTTKGNQLLDFSEYDSRSSATMTLTFENDVLTTTCIASGTYRSFTWIITDLIKANPGKTLSFTFDEYDKSQAAYSSVNLQIYTGSNVSYFGLVRSDGTSVPYTIPEDVSNISTVNFRILPNNSATAKASTLVITKPMLQFGTEKLDYEEYSGGKPSPSIDFPQEIINVSGNVIINNSNGTDEQSITIDMQKNELCSVDDMNDKLVIDKNGNTSIIKNIIKIDSYKGETISTKYKSTTGELSTGATVYYISDEPQIINLGKNDILSLYNGINNIKSDNKLGIEINCINTVDTEIRNIKVGDNLSDKIIFFDFPWESYTNITNTEFKQIIELDSKNNIQYKYNPNNLRHWIAYHYEDDKTNYILYSKYEDEINNDFNYARYKLPKCIGKVIRTNENDTFYQYIKIKDNDYKLQNYKKRIWQDNDIPYLQYIDNIEEGINNVAKILYEPNGYEHKIWTITGYYGIGSNDYGLAQKPISNKDFERWNKNIELLELIIDSHINIWNIVSYINWDEECKFEWED